MSELDDQLSCCIQRHPFATWPDDEQRPSFSILFLERVDIIILLVPTKKKITGKEYIYDSSLIYIFTTKTQWAFTSSMSASETLEENVRSIQS